MGMEGAFLEEVGAVPKADTLRRREVQLNTRMHYTQRRCAWAAPFLLHFVHNHALQQCSPHCIAARVRHRLPHVTGLHAESLGRICMREHDDHKGLGW